jgi:hypothetical protein
MKIRGNTLSTPIKPEKTIVKATGLSKEQQKQARGNFGLDWIEDLASVSTSKNLYDNSLVIDKKIINFDPNYGILGNLATSVLSGYVPVKEGKTYTITNGEGLYIGAIAFVSLDETTGKFSAVCARSPSAYKYGTSAASWAPIGDYVSMASYTTQATFTVLEGSGITHAIWYITTSASSNYYGAHDGIGTIADRVQMNEGNTLYQYDEYGTNAILVRQKNVVGLPEMAEDVNYMLSRIKPEERVTVTLSDGDFSVRSAWDAENDISIFGSMHAGANRIVKFNTLKVVPKGTDHSQITAGSLWGWIDDDIAPIKFNNSFMGGNHGYSAGYTLTFSESHSLTNTAIGSSFTDENNQEYVLLSIPSKTTLLVCSTYTGDVNAPLLEVAPFGSITGNGVTLAFTKATATQICPAVNHVHSSIWVDGCREAMENGSYKGKFVDIVEQYDIIDIPAMLTYLSENAGNNTNTSYYSDAITQRYCRVTNIYRFTERGVCTVWATLDFETTMLVGYAGLVQTACVQGDYYSVPLSNKATLSALTGTTNIAKENWSNESVPPNRVYLYTSPELEKGVVVGYAPVGDGTSEARAQNVTTALQIYGATKKLYPRFIQNKVGVKSYSGVAYRIPLNAYTEEVPSVAWYYVGSDIYLLLNIQSAVATYIPLPEHMRGMKAEIVETDGDIDLPYAFVSTLGLRVVTNGYGSAVIKLMP